MGRDVLVTLQTGAISAGSRGFVTSSPIPFPFTLTTLYIDSDVASPSVYIKPFVSPGEVSGLAGSNAARKVLSHWGVNNKASEQQAIAVSNGFIILDGLRFTVPWANQRVGFEVINDQSSGTVQPSVTFQSQDGVLSERMTDDEFIEQLAARVAGGPRLGQPENL